MTSLEPVPLLFRARGTTRESLIEGAKQKHTQREGLYDLSIRSRGGGGHSQHLQFRDKLSEKSEKINSDENTYIFELMSMVSHHEKEDH